MAKYGQRIKHLSCLCYNNYIYFRITDELIKANFYLQKVLSNVKPEYNQTFRSNYQLIRHTGDRRMQSAKSSLGKREWGLGSGERKVEASKLKKKKKINQQKCVDFTLIHTLILKSNCKKKNLFMRQLEKFEHLKIKNHH